MNNSMYSLHTRLFEGYNREIRPVKNHRTTTNKIFDFSLFQILSIVNSNSNYFN